MPRQQTALRSSARTTLCIAITALALFLASSQPARSQFSQFFSRQFVANYDLRNADHPNTYISEIKLDLTNPDHSVTLKWAGPQAKSQETGPFRSCPGAGLGNNDCNDEAESRRNGSNCTPKGERKVEGFRDFLRDSPSCHYVTWFDKVRAIGFHSHWSLPDYPASHGCVRMEEHAAQLIHNNAIEGKTKVIVTGTWSRN
jgi:hypothetical protein